MRLGHSPVGLSSLVQALFIPERFDLSRPVARRQTRFLEHSPHDGTAVDPGLAIVLVGLRTEHWFDPACW
jgi:hypothetical protein